MRLSSLSLPQCTPCAWRGSSSRGSWWGRSNSCTDSSRAGRGRRLQRSRGRARREPPAATPTTPADTPRPALWPPPPCRSGRWCPHSWRQWHKPHPTHPPSLSGSPPQDLHLAVSVQRKELHLQALKERHCRGVILLWCAPSSSDTVKLFGEERLF